MRGALAAKNELSPTGSKPSANTGQGTKQQEIMFMFHSLFRINGNR